MSFVYIINSGFLVATYGKIWWVARQQKRKINTQMAGQTPNNNKTGNSDANRTVIAILGGFVGLYFPSILVCILWFVWPDPDMNIMGWLYNISFHCMLMNSGINVFIYALFTKDFKDAMNRLVARQRKFPDE